MKDPEKLLGMFEYLVGNYQINAAILKWKDILFDIDRIYVKTLFPKHLNSGGIAFQGQTAGGTTDILGNAQIITFSGADIQHTDIRLGFLAKRPDNMTSKVQLPINHTRLLFPGMSISY